MKTTELILKYLIYTAIAFIAIIFLIGAFSCNPLKKAQQTFDANKPAAAEYCADRFPVKDSLIKGDTLVTTDTLYVKEYDTIVDTIKLKSYYPTKYITKTIRITDTVIRRDNAREQVLANQVRQCNDVQIELIEKNTRLSEQVDEMKGKRDKWRTRFFILLGLTIAYVGLRVKKLIPF